MLEYLQITPKESCITVLFILIETAMQTLSAAILAQLLDNAAKQNISLTFWLFFLNAIVFGVFLLFRYLSMKFRIYTVQRMVKEYRKVVINQISDSDVISFTQKSKGAYVSSLTNDAKLVESNAFDAFFAIVESVSLVSFSAIALLNFHPLLMAVTLFFSVLILLIPNSNHIKNILQIAQNRLSKANEQYTTTVSDLIAGYIDLFQQNRQLLFLSRADNASELLKDQTVTSGYTINRIEFLVTLLNVISQLSVVFVTVLLVLHGAVSAGTLLSVGQLSGNIFNHLDTISSTVTKVQSVHELLHCKNSHKGLKSAEEIAACDSISLRGVNYAYDCHSVFHSPINFTIELGKKYAIVGRSGAGKSTLVNILCGNYPDYQGSILVGNTELRNLDRNRLHNFMILMRQDPHLFSFSVEDNIFLGASHHPEDLKNILNACALTDVISALPQGADTVLNPGKIQLSGGQQQRLLLARVLASGCPVIILDEPTSSQDKETGFAIENQLLRSPDLTVVMITHHMNPVLADYFDGILEI